MCPTAELGDYPNWQRPGLRYVESDLGEITSELTHNYDPVTHKFKKRAIVIGPPESPGATPAQSVLANLPIPPVPSRKQK